MKSSEKAVITVIGKDMAGSSADVAALSEQMDALGGELGLKIHVMHEDIFNSMHKI